MKNTAPVNMTGAVSPADRDTCKIRPVRIPLMLLGKTMPRIVCHLVAPTFQQASRNDCGTADRASFVLAMITGNVMIASVRDAAITDRPIFANSTNAPRPNNA